MKGLLTREQIITLWSKQDQEIKESFGCPDCRDILLKNKDGFLTCNNRMCNNIKWYTTEGFLVGDKS